MLKIGVFGVGHLGKFHLNNWKEIDGVEIVGFYDPNDVVANDVIAKYNIKRYLHQEELIELIDAADIVAPTPFHFQLCESVIRKGKHVFVEKPLANSLEEGKQLVNMAREANVKVSVVLDLMIHDIDIILSLVKSDVRHISASGVAVMTDTPDIANVRIEFNNGCVANLTSSRISMKKMRKMRLFQKDAYIGIDFLEKKTEIIRQKKAGDDEQHVFSFDLETPLGKKVIAIANPEIKPVNAIKAELEAFVQSIVQNKPTVVSEIDGFMAMQVAHKILEKINNSVKLS